MIQVVSRKFLNSLLALSLTCAIAPVASANPPWARDYIGEVKFRLSDNPILSDLMRDVDHAKTRLARVDNELDRKKDRVYKLEKKQREVQKNLDDALRAIKSASAEKERLQRDRQSLPGEIQSLKQKVSQQQQQTQQQRRQLQNMRQKLQELQGTLQTKTQECKNAPSKQCKQEVQKLRQQVNNHREKANQKQEQVKASQQQLNQSKTQLANKETRLSNLDQLLVKQNQIIEANKRKGEQSRNQKENVDREMAQAIRELRPLEDEKRKVEIVLRDKQLETQRFRDDLIARILEANHRGARIAERDGRDDGMELAKDLGYTDGKTDGAQDGEVEGTKAGKDRDYRRGYDAGQITGADRAQTQGQRVGSREGTRQGNIDAATSAGVDAGKLRAQNSDAAQVGTAQGQVSGMDRAVSTGKVQGSATGESQAINQFEQSVLAQKTIDGAFAGAFSRRIPSFPSGHVGRAYNPRGDYRRPMINEAYSDGYHVNYRREQRYTYESNINRVYNNYYDDYYRDNYNIFVNRSYDQEYAKGENKGNNHAYNRDYPGIHRRYFDEYRVKFRNAPNRQSSEYKDTFSNVELATYTQEYEVIRSTTKDRVDEQTYQTNIAEQTEKFRALRFAEVAKVYQSAPVLKFVSSAITDGGINGNSGQAVAAKDGVYQPGESIFHDVVITNFSLVNAEKVKVSLTNGSTIELPILPAQSTVTVKGAAKSTVTSRSGERHQVLLTAYAPITQEAKIQARHFANATQGQMNEGDSKSVPVYYPVAITTLATQDTLVINESNKLKLSLVTQSERGYTGPIDVILNVDSSSSIITKGFNPIQSLSGSASLSDAMVRVSSESDTYSPLTFTAKLVKDGVTLAPTLTFNTMAKAPYVEKKDAPVIVADSEVTRRDLVDMVQELGGISSVSILDLSLQQKNTAVMSKGVTGKSLLVIDEGYANSLKAIDAMLSRSKDTTIVAINTRDLSSALNSLASFRHDQSPVFNLYGLGKKEIFFTNPLRNRHVSHQLQAFSSDITNFKTSLVLADYLKLNADEFLQKIAATMNSSNFFGRDGSLKLFMQAFNVKVVEDIITVNDAYLASGNVFNRDEDIAERIRKDSSLFHNKLAKLVDRGSSTAMYLTAYDTYRVILALNDKAMGIDLAQKVTTQLITKGFNGRSSASYELKKAGEDKLSRDLRKSANRNKAFYRPFDYSGEFPER